MLLLQIILPKPKQQKYPLSLSVYYYPLWLLVCLTRCCLVLQLTEEKILIKGWCWLVFYIVIYCLLALSFFFLYVLLSHLCNSVCLCTLLLDYDIWFLQHNKSWHGNLLGLDQFLFLFFLSFVWGVGTLHMGFYVQSSSQQRYQVVSNFLLTWGIPVFPLGLDLFFSVNEKTMWRVVIGLAPFCLYIQLICG